MQDWERHLADDFSDADLQEAAADLKAMWRRGQRVLPILVFAAAFGVLALPLVLALRG